MRPHFCVQPPPPKTSLHLSVYVLHGKLCKARRKEDPFLFPLFLEFVIKLVAKIRTQWVSHRDLFSSRGVYTYVCEHTSSYPPILAQNPIPCFFLLSRSFDCTIQTLSIAYERASLRWRDVVVIMLVNNVLVAYKSQDNNIRQNCLNWS